MAPAYQSEKETRRVANDRWEFCLLYEKRLTFYTTGGKRETNVRDHYAAGAELGDQGWELVAVLPSGTMCFQRRIQ
jgi:hypothetical protein